MVPFYLEVSPPLARAQLDYRYVTLDGARRQARTMGCLGACFAWESTVTGDDVTPRKLMMRTSGQLVPIFTGMEQIHITGDVAYAISRYWAQTGDTAWMLERGLEILIETARFWCSRLTERSEVLHLLRVVGPDEYHHDVDDNLYTNWMARLGLQVAVDACHRIAQSDPRPWSELERRLGVRPSEIEAWSKAAARIYIPVPNSQGVIEQFKGYFELEPATTRLRDTQQSPMQRLLEWEHINRQQLIKQADVLMVPFLFPDAFPLDVVKACYRYYEPRTDHGSSLSYCVHAAIAAQIGDWGETDRFWRAGLQLDLQDGMRNTALGIHLGNMGGTWQALRFHILRQPIRDRFLAEYGPLETERTHA